MCRKLSPTLLLTNGSQKTYTDKYYKKTHSSSSHTPIFLLFLSLTLLSIGATNMTTTKDSKPRSVRQSLMAIDPEVQQELDNIYVRLNGLSDGISDLRADLNGLNFRIDGLMDRIEVVYNNSVNSFLFNGDRITYNRKLFGK